MVPPRSWRTRASGRPGPQLALGLEALAGEAERRVRSRAHVLERDEGRQLDHAGVVQVLAESRDQLVRDGRRGLRHRLRVLQHQALEVAVDRAGPPACELLELARVDM